MVRGARYIYVALTWAFVAGLVIQVYLIGLGLFASSDYAKLHATFGWLLHLVPPFILLTAAAAAAGRRLILQTTALTITIFIVPILAAIRADAPLAAAFHPVGAVLAFLLAILVARGATRLLRSTDPETPTGLVGWVLVALLAVIYLVLSLGGSAA
jgi:nicotinamide riboside transporter PnuC